MGWKKMIMGQKMPDEKDPKYAARKKRDVLAGEKTAKFLRLDKLAMYAQSFAIKRPKMFLILVFGVVGLCVAINVYRLVYSIYYFKDRKPSAVEMQDEALRNQTSLKNIKHLNHDDK